MQNLGAPREIDPGMALLEEIHRAAGHVAWLGAKVRSLDESQLVWSTIMEVREKRRGGPGGDYELHRQETRQVVNAWWELYERERRHLANTSVAALKAGVEERRVRLAERSFEVLEAALSAALEDLGHDSHDSRVREIVGRHLRAAITVVEVDGSPVQPAPRSSELPSVFNPTRSY
jgi:hypothetical protein